VQDPDDWFIKMCGGGAMIAEPKVFGRLFIDAPVRDYDDLEFVCRGRLGRPHETVSTP